MEQKKPKIRIKTYQNIACAHQLSLSYDSPCNRLHGHNYGIWVTIEGNELNSEGMIVDYSKIKNVIKEFDHQNLNKLMSPDGETQVINPTAENLAKNIYFKLKSALYLDEYKVQVEVSETENNFATFGDLD